MSSASERFSALRWRVGMSLAILGLCLTASAPGAEEAQQGFVAIFDGKTLDGWQGATDGYEAAGGVLVCKKACGGRLFTVKEFGDFVFRFEFKLEPGGNNGISIRGYESQILDDDAPVYKRLQPFSYHGSIIRCRVAAKRGYMKPAGEWNAEEIECRGSRWKITLNGVVIVDVDLAQIPGEEAAALAKRTTGPIGLLGHHSHVEFRNLRVKEL